MSGFDFHASATAIGGVITSPGGAKTIIPSLASINLAKAGGIGDAVATFQHPRISFTQAASHVSGTDLGGGIFLTEASVRITDLTACDQSGFTKLSIGSMTALMTSTRDVTQPDSQFQVLLTYAGIRINGIQVTPLLDTALCNSATFADVATTLGEDAEEYATAFGVSRLRLEAAITPPHNEAVGGALVKGFFQGGELSRRGFAWPIPGYGVVYFAEFRFQPARRNVSMLRLSLNDSGYTGDITLAAVEGNGSPPF